MPDFTFDPDSHTYRLDGAVIPSVTQLLKPIGPDFSMVNADVLERKRALGVVVHECCQYDDEDDLDDESVPEVVEPHLAAWRKFKADSRAQILANERQLFHAQLRYAGTLDRLVSIDGALWLIDLKTSVVAHPSYGVQLAGYQELLQANDAPGATIRRATVQLRGDGSYKLVEFKNPNDHAAFRALIAIHSWKESTK